MARNSPKSLAEYLGDYLRREGLSFRQAAELAEIPASTLHAVVTRPGGLLKRSTRDGLVRLGLDADVVDALACQQAGLSALELSADEWELLERWRKLSPAKRAKVQRYVTAFASGRAQMDTAGHDTPQRSTGPTLDLSGHV